MRKKAYALFAGAAILLLVGAGCGAKQSASVQVPGGASVDSTTDAILKNDANEQAEASKVEDDANDVNGDTTEINGYSDSTYELK